jgi:hypothetical protein
MAAEPRDLPTPDEDRDLHCRLMEGDPTASVDLAVAYLNYLIEWLRRCNSPDIDDHLVSEAAETALVALIKNPATYRTDTHKTLPAYLQMSASCDLKNSLKARKRHTGRTIPLETVALSPDAGKYLGEVDDPLEQLVLSEEASRARQDILPRLCVDLSAEEIECLELLIDSERKTAAYARALKIEHLPDDDQRARVKQVKDKLQQRIKRGRSRDD